MKALLIQTQAKTLPQLPSSPERVRSKNVLSGRRKTEVGPTHELAISLRQGDQMGDKEAREKPFLAALEISSKKRKETRDPKLAANRKRWWEENFFTRPEEEELKETSDSEDV